MNEESIRTLLNNIRECDSLHNNCDYLLEHDESYILVDYIDNLQQERDKYKSTLEEIRKECEANIEVFDSDKSYSIAVRDISVDILRIMGLTPEGIPELLEKKIKELEEGNSNE